MKKKEMISELLVLIFTTIIVYFVYTYKRSHYYLDKRGVKYVPGVPLFGNSLQASLQKRHPCEDFDAVYKAFPDEKYVGFIETSTVALIIRDPELIKNITVKDFDHFTDHRSFFENSELFGGSLVMMKGEKWHDMRATLSPAFTSSKMKQIMPFMAQISDNIIEHLKDHQLEDIDLGDIMHRYTNDVIASAGFGLQVNSLKDKENEFYMAGQNLFKFNAVQKLLFIATAIFPGLLKILKINLFPEKTIKFFRHLVTSTMEYREKNNVERPDIIQLLMQASKGILKHTADSNEKDVGFAATKEIVKPQGAVRQWSQDELCGQVFLFFIAGFESSASVLVMCIHELTINPEVQEKLYQEIRTFHKKNSSLTFDNITELKYLDCVLNETMRKWTSAMIMDRVCVKPYELPPPREGAKTLQLKPGDFVYNSLYSIHMDPKYYPQPKLFDPDRFSDENKHKIKPFTFMPFGVGPRNCIGSRFALLEIKLLVYKIVLNFKLLKCEKTSDPIELHTEDFNIKAKGGSWIRMELRQ
uniref:unspecific monooxygenase n=1 Tax=Streltzoviella insularis TaxID=1206366 RepID=A0A7D5UMT9_9NEOP|nr:cytochrome P450 22 [Streltzoviella insularis]